jgi:transposase
MQAYSLDLRQRIVNALLAGATIEQVAQRFSVGTATVKRYKARLETTGTLAATPWPGRAPKIKEEQKEILRALVASRTDWTLETLCHAWQKEQGTPVTISVMSDTLKRFHFTYKKRAASPPNETRANEPPSESK